MVRRIVKGHQQQPNLNGPINVYVCGFHLQFSSYRGKY